MILKQFYLRCLGHAFYIIGDEATGTAAVVDPQQDTDQYTAFAADHALQIKHVFLTHLQADFLAGHNFRTYYRNADAEKMTAGWELGLALIKCIAVKHGG